MPSLRQVRLARLWSQQELARRSGVAVRTIVYVENGERAPTLSTIRRLTEALGVDWREVDEFRRTMEGLEEKVAD